MSGAHRQSTRRIGEELWSILKDGEVVVNLSELARRTGYSRPTVYRALTFFTRFGKVRQIEPRRTGKRRPGIYTLNPAYLEETRESTTTEEKAVCGVSVNPSTTPQERLKEKPLKPLTDPVLLNENGNDQRLKLTRWLANSDVDRPPTDREKRKLSVAVRLMIPPSLADPLLDALWWRVSAPLRLWRDVIGAVWFGVSVRDASEAVRPGACLKSLQRLEQDGDRTAFVDALENEPEEERKRRIRWRLQGLRQWRIAQGEDCTGERLSWFVEKRAELERKQEALSWT